MMNVNHALKHASAVLRDHAPAILTAFGAVGTVGTAVLAGKASYEACGKIRNEIDERYEEAKADPTVEIELTKTEILKLVWPLYVPAVTTGTATVAAILLSHRISSKRAAALAAAYALNQDKIEEYQEKVRSKFGDKKEKEARDEIAQERVNAMGDAGFVFANPMTGKVWIMEAYTGRPFLSTVEDVKHAVNEINHEIEGSGSARLSDFYDLLGLEHVSTSDYFGFTRDERLSIDWSTTTSPDGSLAVHVFEYVNDPVMNPEREASFR